MPRKTRRKIRRKIRRVKRVRGTRRVRRSRRHYTGGEVAGAVSNLQNGVRGLIGHVVGEGQALAQNVSQGIEQLKANVSDRFSAKSSVTV